MGIFSGIGSFFGPVGSVLGGVADGIMARNDAEDANSANAANARTMRQTAYQDTVQDLTTAGLNPMLAYSNGPTSGNMPPMQNKGLQAAQTTSSQSAGDLAKTQLEQVNATTANTNAQTLLVDAQRRKVEAEIPQVTTSTANIGAQTRQIEQNILNLKEEIHRVVGSKNLMYQQELTEGTRRGLMDAQKDLAYIQEKLANKQIDNVMAQTETQKVITRLKGLEVPGAQNQADFERLMETGGGNAAGGASTIMKLIQLFKAIK